MILSDAIRVVEEGLSAAGVSFHREEPLRAHTTFRIGGNAALMVFPVDAAEAVSVLKLCRNAGAPYFFLGAGSNLLAPDAGVRAVVLSTRGMQSISISHEADGSALVTAGAGVGMTALARFAEDAGLTGMEFLYGIPGSVGGGVAMNAGAYGGEIADILVSSVGFDAAKGEEAFVRDADAHLFSYRKSAYLACPTEIVLSATFRLKLGNTDVIHATMQDILNRRKEKQPLEYPSAGSFFKRPEGTFAGKLIEDVGLKGYRIGGAEVSVKHAGFLINRGGATEADVRALAAHVRAVVLRETGYLLESEVRTMGGDPL